MNKPNFFLKTNNQENSDLVKRMQKNTIFQEILTLQQIAEDFCQFLHNFLLQHFTKNTYVSIIS